jgi:hypothetical protein
MNCRTTFLLALCASATMAASASDSDRLPSRSALEFCKASLFNEFEFQIHESISEEEIDYKENAGFKFGFTNGNRAFVQYSDSNPIEVKTIPFTDLQNLRIRLKPEDLAIDKSDLYVRRGTNQKTYCLLAPFGGLGSSGSFQGIAALIAGEVRAGVASQPVGEVVRRR